MLKFHLHKCRTPGRSLYLLVGLGAANSGLPTRSPSKHGKSTETNGCLAKRDFRTCSALWYVCMLCSMPKAPHDAHRRRVRKARGITVSYCLPITTITIILVALIKQTIIIIIGSARARSLSLSLSVSLSLSLSLSACAWMCKYYVHMNVYVYILIYRSLSLSLYIDIYIHVYIYIYIHMYTHTCINTHIYIYIYIIHTQTHVMALLKAASGYRRVQGGSDPSARRPPRHTQ